MPRHTQPAVLLIVGLAVAADAAAGDASPEPARRSDAAVTDAGSEAYPQPPPSEYDLVMSRGGPPARPVDAGGSFASQGLRTLAVLAVVIALIYLSLRVLRRFLGQGLLKGQDGQIAVLARSYLDPRHSLSIVQVGRRYFLIGTADQAMVSLAELSAEDVAASRDQAAPAAPTAPASFWRVLLKKQDQP